MRLDDRPCHRVPVRGTKFCGLCSYVADPAALAVIARTIAARKVWRAEYVADAVQEALLAGVHLIHRRRRGRIRDARALLWVRMRGAVIESARRAGRVDAHERRIGLAVRRVSVERTLAPRDLILEDQ